MKSCPARISCRLTWQAIGDPERTFCCYLLNAEGLGSCKCKLARLWCSNPLCWEGRQGCSVSSVGHAELAAIGKGCTLERRFWGCRQYNNLPFLAPVQW